MKVDLILINHIKELETDIIDSSLLQEVTELTKGKRNVLVSWITNNEISKKKHIYNYVLVYEWTDYFYNISQQVKENPKMKGLRLWSSW